jgi:hypothetical protein
MSQFVQDHLHPYRKPAKLSSEALAGSIALSLTAREKEWIAIILNDPDERLTYREVGSRKKPPIEENGAQDYTERVLRKIYIGSAGWSEAS